MKPTNRNLLFALMLLPLAACHKSAPDPETGNPQQPIDNPCHYQEATFGFIAIGGPNTAAAGLPVSFPVLVAGKDGCAYQAHTSVSSATGGALQLQSMVDYQGCFCTLAITQIPDTLTYTFPQPGVYTLSAPNGNGGNVTHTVTVQ